MDSKKWKNNVVSMNIVRPYARDEVERDFDELVKEVVGAYGNEVEKILCLQNLAILDLLRTISDDIDKIRNVDDEEEG